MHNQIDNLYIEKKSTKELINKMRDDVKYLMYMNGILSVLIIVLALFIICE